MKLTFDLPKEYNDMSKGEIAQLSMKVKKLVDDLNYILSNLSEENLSKALKEKINTASEQASACLDAIEEMKGGEGDVSAVGTILSEDSGADTV